MIKPTYSKEVLRALYPIGHERKINQLAQAIANLLFFWKR